MAAANRWSRRYQFWQAMPPRSHALFLVGVFFMFLASGVLADIPRMGGTGPVQFAANALFAGGIAVGYVVALRQGLRWLAAVMALHLLIASQFDRIFGPPGAPLSGDALQARLLLDVNGATTAIIVAFVVIDLVRTESTRYSRVHAEIALAGQIHKQLVPRISQRIDRFEFHGVSLASGDVGGDLVDVVDSPDGWTSLVADVSGHGVAAGLLMGMVKSSARTQLRRGAPFDDLLKTLNEVLYTLKGPAMFVTFAGLQYHVGAELRFTVAGHLPILHYRAATTDIAELSIAQLPLAMFSETAFSSAPAPCAPGDLFAILTDGLTEVFDGADREFGLDRVKSVVREHAAGPLEALADHLLAAVRTHGRQLDDQTLLLVRAHL